MQPTQNGLHTISHEQLRQIDYFIGEFDSLKEENEDLKNENARLSNYVAVLSQNQADPASEEKNQELQRKVNDLTQEINQIKEEQKYNESGFIDLGICSFVLLTTAAVAGAIINS